MRIDEGVDGDAQRISQLTWMIFLKVFDDREEEYEIFDDDYISPLPQELRWRNWAADAEGITGDELLEFVNGKLFQKLKNLNLDEVSDPKGRIVRDAFEDAFNFMKNVINRTYSGTYPYWQNTCLIQLTQPLFAAVSLDVERLHQLFSKM